MLKNDEFTGEELAEIGRRQRRARAKARQIIKNADPVADEAVLAAARSDPDALPMTDEQLARMHPAHEVLPGLVAKYLRRGRPKLASPKRQVTLRLDADVLDHFKAGGSGWQTAINETLRKAIGGNSRRAASKRPRPELRGAGEGERGGILRDVETLAGWGERTNVEDDRPRGERASGDPGAHYRERISECRGRTAAG